MKKTLHLATAQFSPLAGNLGYNIKTMCDILTEAAQRNIKLVLFPELAVSGYDLNLIEEGRCFLPEDGSGLNYLLNTCKKLKINAVVGCCIKKTFDLYNCALIINELGELSQIYDKQFLDEQEKNIFNYGNKVCTFKIDNWCIGVSISYDSYSLNLARKMQILGVEIYLVLGAFIKGGYYSLNLNHFSAIAKECKFYVAVANYIGQHSGMSYAGNSCIYSPNGDLLNNCFENLGITSAILTETAIEELSVEKNKNIIQIDETDISKLSGDE